MKDIKLFYTLASTAESVTTEISYGKYIDDVVKTGHYKDTLVCHDPELADLIRGDVLVREIPLNILTPESNIFRITRGPASIIFFTRPVISGRKLISDSEKVTEEISIPEGWFISN